MLHNPSDSQLLNDTYDYPYENNITTTLSPTAVSPSESM